MHLAFLDEFGHIGPFVGRSDPKYNSSPVFGLGGYIIPHHQARSFATWFYQLKEQLLHAELKKSGKHPATWEKKGAELFTTKNIRKYRHIREAAARTINKIYKIDGRIFYYGRLKYLPPGQSHAAGLYTTVLGHTIRQIDRFCVNKNSQYLMILDQHSDRLKLIEASAKTMFGQEPARCLIEPPFHVESHLYQTVQAADWIATLIGRLTAYREKPNEYSDWDWADRYFGKSIDAASTHSSFWRPRPVVRASGPLDGQ